MSAIAAFDFDGTITNRDTFTGFLQYSFNCSTLIRKSLILMPTIILYWMKIVSSENAKQKCFSQFFQGMTQKAFLQQCESYSLTQLKKHIRPVALERIHWHQNQGHEVIIVTASLAEWIKPWAHTENINIVIATIPEIKNGIVTGAFNSRNCKGIEKVNRFLEVFPERKTYTLYAYGDTIGDKNLLDFADNPYFQIFN